MSFNDASMVNSTISSEELMGLGLDRDETVPPLSSPFHRTSLKRSASPDTNSKFSSPRSEAGPPTPTRHYDSRPPSSRISSFVPTMSVVKTAPLQGVVSASNAEPVMTSPNPGSVDKLCSVAAITTPDADKLSRPASVRATPLHSRSQSRVTSQTHSRSQSQQNLSGQQMQPAPYPLSPTPQTQPQQPVPEPPAATSGWALPDPIRRLTNFFVKSGLPTPRTLSVSSPGESSNSADGHGETISRSATPKPGSSQASVSGATGSAKGKLNVRILEARGLPNLRDPHVVAVFQRTQLISGPAVSEEAASSASGPSPVPNRPMAMQRTESSQGRLHAVPMSSRQNSNGSDRPRAPGARRSFSNPKWDAHGTFDVVNSDSLLDVCVYEQDADGKEVFYGHVTLDTRNEDHELRGWHALEGHADTDQPSGEIYLEVSYQRSERRHFGPGDFDILRLLGKGTFGQVYQVRKKDTGRVYAMKVLSKKIIVQKKEVAHTVGERNILVRTATTDSPFIVGLKFSFQTPSDLYLVTDYMSGGELFWHLQKENKFTEARAKFYIAELILAIQHLHKNDIVYRDLKPENILLDANGHISLCDFGLSKANLTKDSTTTTFCGTTEYLAPEVLLDETGYTKMVDFWSLGVLVFEMCCGWSPFYAADTQQMYKNIAFGKVRFPRDVLSAKGRSFVKSLLNRNPSNRLGAKDDAAELMRHPFFDDIQWDMLARKLITPPFKPTLQSDTDVRYFDTEFTEAMDKNNSLNERAMALARGVTTSTPLSPSVQANFQGFTFVDESALEENMGGHESDGVHSDDEWDTMQNEDFDGINLSRNRNIRDDAYADPADDFMISGHQFDM